MTEPTDADRAKAAAILWHQFSAEDVDRVAAVLAAERAAAVADLRARVEAVAEELRDLPGLLEREYVADRLRAAVTDTTGGAQ